MSDENLPKIMRAVATLRANGSGSLAINGSHEDLRESDTEQLRGVIAERLREAAEREGRPIHVLTTEDGDEAAIMVHPSGDIDENVPMLPPPAWLRRTTPSAEADPGENAQLPRSSESFAPSGSEGGSDHGASNASRSGSPDDFDWQPPAANAADEPAASDERLQEPVEETTLNPWRPPHFEEASTPAPAEADAKFPEDSGPVSYGRRSGEKAGTGHAEKDGAPTDGTRQSDSPVHENADEVNDATIARPSSDPTPTHPTKTAAHGSPADRGGAKRDQSDAATPDAVQGAAEHIGIPNGAAFSGGHDPHAREFSPQPATTFDEETRVRPGPPRTGVEHTPGATSFHDEREHRSSYRPQGVDDDNHDDDARSTSPHESNQPSNLPTLHDENAYLAGAPERASGSAGGDIHEQGRMPGQHGVNGQGMPGQGVNEQFGGQPFPGAPNQNEGQRSFPATPGHGGRPGLFAPHPHAPNQNPVGQQHGQPQGMYSGQNAGQHQGHNPAGAPTLNSLLAERPKEKPAPAEKGFGGFVRSISGGLITMPPGQHELQLRKWTESVQRSLNGPKTIVVVNPKGGAQKTTATLLIAATFGLARGGYTLAWDNNETRGTLGWRAAHSRHSNTAVNLLHDLDRFTEAAGSRVGDLDNYVRGQGDAQFDVLASDEDAAASSTIDAEAFNRLHQTLQRFYRVLVIDTGNNMRASNWTAAVEAADQLVIVSTVREDTAQSAAWLVDGLRERGLGEKVANGVTILGSTSKKGDPQLNERLHRHFGQLTRSVVDVPYDPALVDGSSLRMPLLSKHTREAWLHASAEIAEGL